MYIISLTYKVSMDQVDLHLEDHVRFLDEQYEQGHILASGRKVPRTGGIILSNIRDEKEIRSLIEKDPFKIHGVADYELIRFVPSKTAEELNFLLE